MDVDRSGVKVSVPFAELSDPELVDINRVAI